MSPSAHSESWVHRWGRALPPAQRVYAAFFLYALSLGGLFPRMGEIQQRMGVGEGALGLALIGTACGTMLSLTWGHALIERVGYRRCLLWLLPATATWYALAAWAAAPWVLFSVLLPAGVGVGALEIIVNVEADRVEHALGRRIMNRAHGFWSLGFFVAGMVGAGSAWLGISPQLQLSATVLLVLISTLLLLGRFAPSNPRPQMAGAALVPRFARPTRAIFWLVCLTFSAMVMEGAGIDWSAIYMRDVFGVAPFVAGLAVATGALAQACARFAADHFVERYSPQTVARVLLLALGAGVLVVFAALHPTASLLGFALMGVGSSAIFPLAMSAAAQRHDRPAAINVAALSQLSFMAFLLAPPLLGFVAEHWGIRYAFGLGLPLVVVSWLAVSSLDPEG
ncbi:MFS transporter [Hydrogenophaga sp.]|uniref:MFS transporter n=1 Tax=Hydrogenophaga sp. TaxID=1904254 RepID=UPI003F6ADCD7